MNHTDPQEDVHHGPIYFEIDHPEDALLRLLVIVIIPLEIDHPGVDREHHHIEAEIVLPLGVVAQDLHYVKGARSEQEVLEDFPPEETMIEETDNRQEEMKGLSIYFMRCSLLIKIIIEEDRGPHMTEIVHLHVLDLPFHLEDHHRQLLEASGVAALEVQSVPQLVQIRLIGDVVPLLPDVVLSPQYLVNQHPKELLGIPRVVLHLPFILVGKS